MHLRIPRACWADDDTYTRPRPARPALEPQRPVMLLFSCLAQSARKLDLADNERWQSAGRKCDGCGNDDPSSALLLSAARHLPDATAWVRVLPLEVLADILQLAIRRADLARIAVLPADGVLPPATDGVNAYYSWAMHRSEIILTTHELGANRCFASTT